ncbi:MAG: porin family protein [Desulfobaccales bacterium]
MIKRLALLICCVLLLPTIAAAQEGSTNYGDFWVGGQVGGLFTAKTDPGVMAGATVGYNFCMSYRPSWQRYFGVALDFQWNQLNWNHENFYGDHENQFALAPLARLQYPLMGDESFTRGRYVPFFMFGPAIVWTDPNSGQPLSSRTDFGAVAEIGLEYFVIPQLSVGPSYRFRWVSEGGGEYQHTILARLAYHF